MGKQKQKLSKNLADKVRKSKAAPEIQKNPFEVKINRKKFDVLGRKGKHDVGLPGVSRSKAINKRKETLLKEFRLKDKNNQFIDRRFGEYDSKITPEDKILQRFTLEKQRTQDKKDMYNLNEEEELTHYGQSLAEMEKMTDVIDSDESDSEEKGLLSAELTAAHFGGGGGLLRKKKTGDEDDKPKSRQELIEDLITKSKQEKRERQTMKEESQVLTDKLDQDWKSIQKLLAHKTPKSERKDLPEKTQLEEYDVMVRELGFEMKAQPSERLKSAEELAREEKERLQTLEADRVRRMMGDTEEESAHTDKHISADDINDGFILDGDDRKTLTYKDGKWNLQDNDEDAKEADGDDDDEGKDDEEGDEDGGEDDEEGNDDDEEDGGEDDEDYHSDLQSDEGSEDDEDQVCDEEEVPVKVTPAVNQETTRAEAKAELPYTFKAPESYDDLKSLLKGYSSDEQRLILDRTVKCTHPSLSAGNKVKLQKLFGFVLEYVGELATQNPPELKTINSLIPQIYSLCQLFPDAACKVMQTLLSDSAHSTEEMVEVKGRAAMPGLDMLIYLKITALLFPTSDFRHPVTTPAFLYISQALTKCSVMSLEDVCKGLVLCCLALEFVSLSQRFFPEMINFLLGLLHLAVPNKTGTDYIVVSPFKQQGKNGDLLVLTDENSSQSWKRKRLSLRTVKRDTMTSSSSLEKDHYRLSIIDACLDLVKRCTSLYTDLTSFDLVFQPIRTLLLNHLPVSGYPTQIQDIQKEILETISAKASQHAPLVFKKKKPIPLKLLTPKIVQILDYGKKKGNTKEEQESERLKHKYKREFKGALREIRKDSRFLAKEKLNDIMSRDAERKRKVKELYGSLATQEGEWKALKRKKGK